ncbi:MAG: GIY-YIG nuclease family protein [Ruminococcus sp.]|jgi:hypothetical protein|nr:GIY-YIG nuclease family protein [Ruminococcus sp.]
MDKSRKKELAEAYKKIPVTYGIFQLKCNETGRIHIAKCNNLKNKYLTLKMQLDLGQFPGKDIQADWKEYGEPAFEYSVLEEYEVKEDTDVKWELDKLYKKYIT